MNMKKILIILTTLLFWLCGTQSFAAYNPGALDVVTPEQFGWQNGVSSTANTTAFNLAFRTAVAKGKCFWLAGGPYILTNTWNATPGADANTNAGFCVRGLGMNVPGSQVLFNMASPNVGNGLDLTGAAYVSMSGLTIGASTNPPKATVLFGAANIAGFVFSGIMNFNDIEFGCNATSGTTTYCFYNGGAEQISFHDCTALAVGTSLLAELVASNNTPKVTSSIATTYTPTQSMTDWHWYHGKGVLSFAGLIGINFHMTVAGGVSAIFFDGYAAATNTVDQVAFMTDDSAGASNTSIVHVGGDPLFVESATGGMQIATFRAANQSVLNFRGYSAYGGGDFAYALFSLGAPKASTIDWYSNTVGGAASVVGLTTGAPGSVFRLGDQTVDKVASTSVSSGFYTVAGTNTTLVFGPTATVSTTTQIYQVSSAGETITVNGAETTNKFTDILQIASTMTGTITPISSKTASGSPQVRTYTMSGGVLSLAMAANTYTTQVVK